LCHRDDKAIAAPRDSLNATAVGSPVVENAPKGADLRREVAVLNDYPWPHGIYYLVPEDEFARPLDQNTENFESARTDRDRNKTAIVIAPSEAPPVEAEALEQIGVGGGERVHASVSLARMSNGRAEAKALNRSDLGVFQTISKDFITVSLHRPLLAGAFRNAVWSAHARSMPTRGRSKMKRWLTKTTLLAAIAFPTVGGAAWAGGSDDFGCSNATLKGEYAFGVTAYTPPGLPNGPPEVVAGIEIFDGRGNFTQRDYQGDSLRTMGHTDFSPKGQEKGTYIVNPDCTGSMVINLNVPVPTGSTGVIETVFVISNGGRHIHDVVARFTPPGFTEAQPTQTSSDAWKVASEQED
jgi:hypothetical protein